MVNASSLPIFCDEFRGSRARLCSTERTLFSRGSFSVSFLWDAFYLASVYARVLAPSFSFLLLSNVFSPSKDAHFLSRISLGSGIVFVSVRGFFRDETVTDEVSPARSASLRLTANARIPKTRHLFGCTLAVLVSSFLLQKTFQGRKPLLWSLFRRVSVLGIYLERLQFWNIGGPPTFFSGSSYTQHKIFSSLSSVSHRSPISWVRLVLSDRRLVN